jgi:hypothetical protein
MKVLLYSHVFLPSTGGVETVSRTLAEGLVQRGVECILVTSTPMGGDEIELPFEVVRQPTAARVRALLGWADVVLFNGASLALQPWLIL